MRLSYSLLLWEKNTHKFHCFTHFKLCSLVVLRTFRLQPSPPSISRTFSSSWNETLPASTLNSPWQSSDVDSALPMQGAQVWFPVGKPRSCMLHGTAKKKKKMTPIPPSSQPLATTILLSVSMNLTSLGAAYKWKQTTVVLCLACFT